MRGCGDKMVAETSESCKQMLCSVPTLDESKGAEPENRPTYCSRSNLEWQVHCLEQTEASTPRYTDEPIVCRTVRLADIAVVWVPRETLEAAAVGMVEHGGCWYRWA